MSFCMFHIPAFRNIYTYVVNQQMHTDDGHRKDRNM